jgi:hypothetical protein
MNNVKVVRLNSGEEIICKTEVKGKLRTIKQPCIIIPTGQGQIGLMPWLAYGDVGSDGVEVKETFVAFTFEPSAQLRNEYSQAFGSGLVVPENDVIGAGGPLGSTDNELKLTT